MENLIEFTDSGIVTMTESEIYALIIEKYQTIDPNWNLDVSTPDGHMAAWMAEQFRIITESIREAWNSKDPAKARGAQLNSVSSITGTIREDGTPTIITGTVTGTSGTVIPAGSVIAGSIYEWTINSDITIPVAGSESFNATCTTNGVIEPDLNSVTNIKTTIGGWTGVTNTGVNTLGTNPESNASLRVKRTKAVARPGSNQVDNTIGEIYSVSDVLRCVPYENPTGTSAVSNKNPYGLPKNSVSYIVQGGSNEAIAQAIYIKKNPGFNLNSVGVPVSVNVVSPVHPSNNKIIDFGRPTATNMIMTIILADPLSNLPSNIEALIQEAVISYTSGEILDDSDGFDQTGFDIGEDVPVRRLDTPINYIIGQYKGAYISSSDINGSTSGVISIDYDAISTWTSANISVTVV